MEPDKQFQSLTRIDEELVRHQYADLFEGLGCLPDKHTITLKSGAEPVIDSPRRIPVTLKPVVIEELKNLEANGIIKPVTGPAE